MEHSAEGEYCIVLNILKVIQLNLCKQQRFFYKLNCKNKSKNFKNETSKPNHKLHNNENAYNFLYAQELLPKAEDVILVLVQLKTLLATVQEGFFMLN